MQNQTSDAGLSRLPTPMRSMVLRIASGLLEEGYHQKKAFLIAIGQVEAGLDVVNDGEQRKSGFTTYLTERLAGFEAVPYAPGESVAHWREVDDFPEYYERYFKTAMFGAMLSPPNIAVLK